MLKKLLPALMLMVCVTIMPGCPAHTETNRAAQGMILTQRHAKDLSALIAYRNPDGSRLITYEQAKAILALIEDEQAAVTAYYDAIRTGNPEVFAAAKAALAVATQRTALELAKYRLPSEPIELPPTTRPQ